jgi:hypothetical protein
MSLRLSIYDFFAYTIPGVFYILVTLLGLETFAIIDLDPTLLSDLSLFTFLVVLGSGYVLGQILDVVAYKWLCFWKGKNGEAREKAIEYFHLKYPWICLRYTPEDWSMLLQAIKIKVPNAAADIEQINASSIMLRNISLALTVTALIFLIAFMTVNSHIGYLILAALALSMSIISLNRASVRRRWFIMGTFEILAADYLLQNEQLHTKIEIKSAVVTPQSETADSG